MGNLVEAEGVDRVKEAWELVSITVRGDCGIIHPTFEDWQRCHVCDAIIKRNTAASRHCR